MDCTQSTMDPFIHQYPMGTSPGPLVNLRCELRVGDSVTRTDLEGLILSRYSVFLALSCVNLNFDFVFLSMIELIMSRVNPGDGGTKN
jgi:hypothetical protein